MRATSPETFYSFYVFNPQTSEYGVYRNVIRSINPSDVVLFVMFNNWYSAVQTPNMATTDCYLFYNRVSARTRTYIVFADVSLACKLLIIHAEHVVHSAWILFSLWMYVCMYVCMYVRALERKRLIGMT